MKGQPEQAGFDPETIFNEGVQYQKQQDTDELREQLAEQMIESGVISPYEVEALFDPAPRRGRRRGKINCSARQRATMPQICKGSGGKHHARHSVRRTYDPAPVGGYRAAARRYGKKAKGLVAGLRPLILPGATLATVYSKYQERAAALKAAGAKNKDGTPVDGAFQALMYDIQNRPTTKMMDRLNANSSEILTPALLGVGLKYGAKKVKLHPKVNQVASMGGDAAIGVAIGKLISTILDPPNPAPNNVPVQTMQTGQRTQIQTNEIPMGRNPFEVM